MQNAANRMDIHEEILLRRIDLNFILFDSDEFILGIEYELKIRNIYENLSVKSNLFPHLSQKIK